MMLPNVTCVALQGEGLTAVGDLSGLTQDLLNNIAASFRRRNVVFGVMSQKRIIDAANCIRYYEVCGRQLTAANIRSTVIRNFGRQWEALMNKKKRADTHEVPKVSKELTIFPWLDAFQDHLRQCIGVRDIPLYYVVRPDVTPPAALPMSSVSGKPSMLTLRDEIPLQSYRCIVPRG